MRLWLLHALPSGHRRHVYICIWVESLRPRETRRISTLARDVSMFVYVNEYVHVEAAVSEAVKYLKTGKI